MRFLATKTDLTKRPTRHETRLIHMPGKVRFFLPALARTARHSARGGAFAPVKPIAVKVKPSLVSR
jgi:hypothetical protein